MLDRTLNKAMKRMAVLTEDVTAAVRGHHLACRLAVSAACGAELALQYSSACSSLTFRHHYRPTYGQGLGTD
jgi:hypothetical protein